MRIRRGGLIVGLLLFVLVLVYHPFPSMSAGANVVLATTLLMATWWLTEAIPMFTAL